MRARNIKPALFKNEILGTANPYLTILFEGLWCMADRDGRLEDRPLRIKAEIFPYREGFDINVYLTELASLEFICRYEVENTPYIQVLKFSKHQNPHKTEKGSEIPPPPGNYKENNEIPDNGSIHVKEPEIPVAARLIPDSLNTDSLNKSEKKFSDADLSLAEQFFKILQKTNPDHKPPNLEKWANDIRLTVERDRRTHEQIIDLFIWANADDFWKSNILSPSKLRQKWDQLTIKRKEGNGKPKKLGDRFAEFLEQQR